MPTHANQPTGASGARYVLQYRDAAGFTWQELTRYDYPGDALIARDDELATEPRHLPTGRHRVVDRVSGSIVEWRRAEIDPDGPPEAW